MEDTAFRGLGFALLHLLGGANSRRGRRLHIRGRRSLPQERPPGLPAPLDQGRGRRLPARVQRAVEVALLAAPPRPRVGCALAGVGYVTAFHRPSPSCKGPVLRGSPVYGRLRALSSVWVVGEYLGHDGHHGVNSDSSQTPQEFASEGDQGPQEVGPGEEGSAVGIRRDDIRRRGLSHWPSAARDDVQRWVYAFRCTEKLDYYDLATHRIAPRRA